MYVVRDIIIDKGPDQDLYNNPNTPIANTQQTSPTSSQQETQPASPAITGPVDLYSPNPEGSDVPKNNEFFVLDEDLDQSEVLDTSDVSDAISNADSSDPIQLFSTASRAKKATIQRYKDQTIVLLTEAVILSIESSLLALPSIQDIERTLARQLDSLTSLQEAKASPFQLQQE